MTDQLSLLQMLDDAEHPTWLLNGKLRNKRAKDIERQSEALVKRAEEMKIELEGLRNYG